MNNINIGEGIKVTGTVRVFSHPAGTYEKYHALLAEDERDEAQALLRGGKLEVEQKNTVMDSPNYGIDLIIQWLTGMGTFASTLLPLSYLEIGTGNTTPTTSDTALTTPTNRALITSSQDYGTTDAIVQAIFSDSQLTNQTYYEAGVFAGGTSIIGSGQIFNHALFASAYTKVAGQDTSIQVDIAFT